MSRAIGDKYLRPCVSAEPEIMIVDSSEEDKFLLVATDGLWHVFTSQEAVDAIISVVRTMEMRDEDITELGGKTSDEESAKRQLYINYMRANIADVLVKQALQKGASDNITVIVKWLD